MRIGINALYLIPGQVGGSETYIRNLAQRLLDAGSGDEFVIFVNRESAGIFEKVTPFGKGGPGGIKEAPGMQVVQCGLSASSRPARILWEQIILPFQIRRRKIDVLLSAGMTAPFFSPVPSVVVIYDLQHKAMPQNFRWWYLQFLRSIIYLSARSADGVITISRKSKDEIMMYYNIASERVNVTYLAVDESVFYRRGPEEISVVRRKHNLPERFVLYAASSLPHKNYVRLLSAFNAVRAQYPDVKLVLIGARDYGMGAIEKRINELGLADSVLFSGWLPLEDLPAVYSGAEIFVFPSLYEGFGMPVLEAFACGAPVVCSNIAPMTEVAAGAALYVDPFDERDIARGIIEVLKDGGLRERLRQGGLCRAEEFSWVKTAAQTLDVLKRYAEGRS